MWGEEQGSGSGRGQDALLREEFLRCLKVKGSLALSKSLPG